MRAAGRQLEPRAANGDVRGSVFRLEIRRGKVAGKNHVVGALRPKVRMNVHTTPFVQNRALRRTGVHPVWWTLSDLGFEPPLRFALIADRGPLT
jgi:hypothetical protein